MQPNLSVYVSAIFFLAAVPYVWMGLYAWRKRPAVAVTPFAWLMLCLSVWALTYSFEILFRDIALKVLVLKIEYISIAAIPVCMIFFALEFTGRSHWVTPIRRAALWAVAIVVILLTWTNEFHYALWNIRGIKTIHGISLLNIEYYPLFGVSIFLLSLMTLSAVLLLLAEMIQRPGDYRVIVNLTVMGMLLPLVSSILYLLQFDIFLHIDLSPLLALPSSFGMSWAITRRYRLQELLPLEYLTVLKNMKDGVIIVNALKRVVYLNPLAENLLGRSEAEAIGQPLNYVSSAYGEKLLSYLGKGESRVELTLGDGQVKKIFEVTISPVSSLNTTLTNNGSDTMIVLHDITYLKENQNALSRRESIMSALGLAAGQFLKESTWEHNIPGVLEKIGQAADLSHIFVAMNYVDHSGHIFSSLCYEWANIGAEPQINNPHFRNVSLRKAGMMRWEQMLAQGNPIVGLVKNLPEEERVFLLPMGSLAIAVMPVFVNQYWWGFIMFEENRHERHWTNTEIEALSIAASMFGSAEARARAELKLLRRQNSLDILHNIVRISLQAEDLLLMAQSLVEPFASLVHADGCSISLWDESSHHEITLAFYDKQQRVQPSITSTPADRTFTEVVLNRMHTLVVEDANPKYYAEEHITKVLPSSSVIVLPLAAGKKKLGAVTLWFDQPHRFQPEEISISEQASNLVALALEKFQTVEQALRRASASETLQKASAAIAESLETEEAVTRILEQLKQVIPYDSASVQILTDDTLTIIGGSGFIDLNAVIGMTFPVPGENPNTTVIETGKPHLLKETQGAYQKFKEAPHNHIQSWLGVPLIFQERIIGLLSIDSATPNRFTEEDIQLAAMFANQVAVTLENARIFKETQDQAITDALTGIYNRRGLFQIGDFELLRARRIGRPFSILMFDIDHFKRVNDHYGHAAGDQVLRGIAERCRTNSRSVDVICRYGGEEFIIFLPDTPLDAANMIAERLRQAVMDTPFATDSGPLRITISIGVTQAKDRDVLKTLIERADHALYAAKRGGRNRVVVHTGATHPLTQI